MPKYRGFLKNQKKILNIDASPEVVFTTDLIYLRYAYAIGRNFSMKRMIDEIRTAPNDLKLKDDDIKRVTKGMLEANQKIFKLNKYHNCIYQGLGDSLRIFELNHKTAEQMDLFFRINVASGMILRAFAAPISPDKVVFLGSVSKVTLNLIQNLLSFFRTRHNELFESIYAFLEVAEIFYRMLTLYIILKQNHFEEKGLIKRTKDYKLNYVESEIIGREIQKNVKELEKMALKSNDAFNVENNRRFAIAFFKKFGWDEATEYFNKSHQKH